MDFGPQFMKFTETRLPPTEWTTETPNFIEQNFNRPGRTDNYVYFPNPTSIGAHLGVNHYGGSTTYRYPVEGRESEWADATTTEEEGQIPAFLMSSTPPSSTVSVLGGTKASRIPAMTMLGIAEVDTNEEFGRSLTPSNNLSRHSRRLVEHLEGVGAATAPPTTYLNTVDFWPYNKNASAVHRYKEIPDERVRAGRSRVRSILKRKNTGTLDQQQLPGME